MTNSYFSKNISIGIVLLFLAGCASSDVSRQTASQIDDVYYNVTDVKGPPDPIGGYQNASQAAKGALIGGVAGAVVGNVSSGIGTVPGALGGAVFGAAIGAYIDKHTNLRDQIENRGGQIFVIGDQVKIVLPSPLIFHSMTPTLSSSAYSTLDAVAQYLRSFPKMSVRIAAYTNATGPARINQEISQEQANTIERYLWMKGVNARLMTATGYGGTGLVSPNSSEWNEGDNYRIEITAEKV